MVNLQNHSGDLLLFAQIVRSGSLSAAAASLGLGRSAVSKRLLALETNVGSRLLQRTTRKMSLTEVGEEILLQAHKIESALNAVTTISDNHQVEHSGKIKVSCPTGIGRKLVVPLLKPFIEKYPNISINLQLDYCFVDLIKDKVDVSIRVGHLADSSLVTRRLGDFKWVICASPEYLATHDALVTPSDLKKHNCLIYQNPQTSVYSWQFQGVNGKEEGVAVKGNLSVNDAHSLVKAAVDGNGVLLIDHVVSSDALATGKLVQVLPNYRPIGGLPIYVVYPAKEFVPARVRAFINFVMSEMKPLF